MEAISYDKLFINIASVDTIETLKIDNEVKKHGTLKTKVIIKEGFGEGM